MRTPLEQINFKAGMQTIPESYLNTIVEVLRQLAGAGAESDLQRPDMMWGKIDSTAQTDYTDERYWVAFAYCSNTGAATEAATLAAYTTAGDPMVQQITATNLAEALTHSHSLVSGILVLLVEIFDRSAPSKKRWIFYSGGGTSIMFGFPTAAVASEAATMTLDPCDAGGADNDQANVTVQAGWTFPTVTGTALTIPTTAIIPFVRAVDGHYHVVGGLPAGAPRTVVTNIQYDTTTHKLQMKLRYSFGIFTTTESDWQDITTAVDCTA